MRLADHVLLGDNPKFVHKIKMEDVQAASETLSSDDPGSEKKVQGKIYHVPVH